MKLVSGSTSHVTTRSTGLVPTSQTSQRAKWPLFPSWVESTRPSLWAIVFLPHLSLLATDYYQKGPRFTASDHNYGESSEGAYWRPNWTGSVTHCGQLTPYFNDSVLYAHSVIIHTTVVIRYDNFYVLICVPLTCSMWCMCVALEITLTANCMTSAVHYNWCPLGEQSKEQHTWLILPGSPLFLCSNHCLW